MNLRYLAATVISAFVTAACGGDKSPTSPAAAGVTGLTVTFPAGGTIYIGATAQLQATETLSDGTTRVVEAAWSSDTPAVAMVSPTGAVTAVSAGETTIAADANTRRGTLRIRVYPNFNGTWRGTESTISCDDSGVFEGLCNDPEFYVEGDRFVHDSRYTQTDGAVAMTLDLGTGLTAAGTGTVTTTGELQLPSTRVQPEDAVVRVDIESLRFRSDTPSSLTGGYAARFSSPGLGGSVLLGLRLDNVTRTSTASAAHRRNNGDRGYVASRRARMRMGR